MTPQGREVVWVSCHQGSLGRDRLCCQSWEEGESPQDQPHCRSEMSFVHSQCAGDPAVNPLEASFLESSCKEYHTITRSRVTQSKCHTKSHGILHAACVHCKYKTEIV